MAAIRVVAPFLRRRTAQVSQRRESAPAQGINPTVAPPQLGIDRLAPTWPQASHLADRRRRSTSSCEPHGIISGTTAIGRQRPHFGLQQYSPTTSS